MDKKKENVIGSFYVGLGRTEKGRFTLWLQVLTSVSQSTVLKRLREDGWKPLERKAILAGIENDEWRDGLMQQ